MSSGVLIYHCHCCDYSSLRKYNLIRHQNRFHKLNNQNSTNTNVPEINVAEIEANVHITQDSVNENEHNTNVRQDDVNENEVVINTVNFSCKKCYKNFKLKKFYEKHEKQCNGLDLLTCPKCMKSFPSRQSKYNHVKRDTCKPRSIIHSKTYKLNNPETTNNDVQTNNNHTNNKNQLQCQNNNCRIGTINNTINNINNININNYGSERLDYITKQDYIDILKSAKKIPLYIEKKHFNEDFPENCNITYTNDNKCMVKQNDNWKQKNLTAFSSKLIKDNVSTLKNYFENNIEEIGNSIQNEDVFNGIKDIFDILINESDSKIYNMNLKAVKDTIMNGV